MENSILKIINNFNLNKTKTKWEVISRLVELYLKSGNILRTESFVNFLKEHKIDVTYSLDPIEKYRADVLELIKILVNSPA